ncbi:MAG: IclR family transcriptional regulator [Acidimicrobiales bacterium]|nr:MAG: IclR family transcriptional regulator [Acidimicrobiales bacterium]
MSETGLSRATAHRLASALEVHGLLRRDSDGRFALGARLIAMGEGASRGWPVAEAAGPALTALRDTTGESAQLYVRDGDSRICVASLESPHGLRTIVATGAALPLDQGSGGRVLAGEVGDGGYVVSIGEREAGVASVSAPVTSSGAVVAAVSVSGPIERLSRDPGPTFGPPVVVAAAAIARAAGLSV